MTQGVLPLTLRIGITLSTTFLNMSLGVVTTLPPKWKRPLLLKGRAVVPSNCSYLTELLPSKSKTIPTDSVAVVSSFSLSFLMFSGDAIHPGCVISTNDRDGSVKYGKLCDKLLAPTRSTFCSRFSDSSFSTSALTRHSSGCKQALKFPYRLLKSVFRCQASNLDSFAYCFHTIPAA